MKKTWGPAHAQDLSGETPKRNLEGNRALSPPARLAGNFHSAAELVAVGEPAPTASAKSPSCTSPPPARSIYGNAALRPPRDAQTEERLTEVLGSPSILRQRKVENEQIVFQSAL
jgi:hypothetical protein